VDSCSHCGGALPADAIFCPSCGRRTDAPPIEPRDVPIDVQHAKPRYFGLGPPVFVLSLAVILVVVGVVLIVMGSVIGGLIAIALAVCLVPTFLAGARRWPDTRIARAGISSADRLRDETNAAVTSIATWSRAGRTVVRLRKDQLRRRRERDAKIRELGRSVFDEDGRAETLKAEAKELDERITANARDLQRTIAGARRRVRKGRAAVVATEVIRPEEEDSDGFDEDATQATSREGRGADPVDDVADAVDVEHRS
jgi:gas vesicle protein